VFGKPKLPAFDPAEGHPLARRGLVALEARDWANLAALYEGQAPSDRFHFVKGLGELSKLDDDIPAEFEDPRMLTIGAGIRVGWAWRHRGAGTGDTVGDTAARNMLQLLGEAEAMLQAAGQKAPEDTTTIAFQIRAELGLDGDPVNLAALLQRASRSPEANIFTALSHLVFVTPKWHGSVEEMWSVANAYASAPHNAAWLALAAHAHIEEYLYAVAMSEDGGLRDAYLAKVRDPGCRALAGEMDDFFWKTASETALSESEALFAHNTFAAFLTLLNAVDRSGPHLERIGTRFSRVPWYFAQYRDNPLEWLNDLRKRAKLPPLRA